MITYIHCTIASRFYIHTGDNLKMFMLVLVFLGSMLFKKCKINIFIARSFLFQITYFEFCFSPQKNFTKALSKYNWWDITWLSICFCILYINKISMQKMHRAEWWKTFFYPDLYLDFQHKRIFFKKKLESNLIWISPPKKKDAWRVFLKILSFLCHVFSEHLSTFEKLSRLCK